MDMGVDDSLPSMDDWVPASGGNDGGGFGKVRARLREIPEVVSARKPLRGNGR